MNRQKSFEKDGASLLLVPTPIGNLEEVSPRIRQALEAADVVACEDTRNTGKLLQLLQIRKPLISHHEHNWKSSIPGILALLEEGKKVAVLSDAGYPLLSDPGQQLVQAVTEAGFSVIPFSGPNAALNALVASGLDTRHFLFYGFLDAKSSRRKKELEALKDLPYTLIFYEAPHRIEEMLADFVEVMGNRPCCLARELTKRHEEFIRGTAEELLAVCGGLKGEMVLVAAGAVPQASAVSLEEAVKRVQELSQSMRLKAAAAQVAEETGLKKNLLYQEALKS